MRETRPRWGEPSLDEDLRSLFEAGDYAAQRASLHCHTTFSDGVLSPGDLIDEAVRQGYDTVSITDHDTVAPYDGVVRRADLPEPVSLDEYAERRRVNLVPGVELSCWWRWHPVHILAYGLDPLSRPVRDLCRMTATASMGNFSVRSWPVQAMSVCLLVRSLGGTPVLAHPRFYWTDIRRMIAELADLGGLGGVETEYEYDTHHLRIQCPLWKKERIARLADEHGLIRTGGSDSHGRDLSHYRR